MNLYVSIKGKQIGPFDEDAVLAHLASGMLSANDMAIRQGDAGWSRLGDIFADKLPVSSQVANRLANTSVVAPSPNWARIFLGCYISMVVVWLGGLGMLSLFGLITGTFYVPGLSSRGFVIYGTWARVLSVPALFYVTWALFSIFRKLRKWISM